MARLSDRYALQYIDDGKGLVLGSDITGEETRIKVANTDGTLGALLNLLVPSDTEPFTPFGEGFPLTAEELVGVIFWTGYFYGTGCFR